MATVGMAQGIAHGILRKWWSISGHHPGSSGGGIGGSNRSWKSLVTDDVVLVAPVEEGGKCALSFVFLLSSLLFAPPPSLFLRASIRSDSSAR